MLWISVMDFGAGREGEEELLNIIGEGTGAEGDDSEFLNESGEGMEEEQPHESERNDDCEDGSQGTGHDLITRSDEVYIYEDSNHESVDDPFLWYIYINECFLLLDV
jgi:hypothetical protein